MTIFNPRLQNQSKNKNSLKTKLKRIQSKINKNKYMTKLNNLKNKLESSPKTAYHVEGAKRTGNMAAWIVIVVGGLYFFGGESPTPATVQAADTSIIQAEAETAKIEYNIKQAELKRIEADRQVKEELQNLKDLKDCIEQNPKDHAEKCKTK